MRSSKGLDLNTDLVLLANLLFIFISSPLALGALVMSGWIELKEPTGLAPSEELVARHSRYHNPLKSKGLCLRV